MLRSWHPHLCFSTLWSISPLSRFSVGWKDGICSPWLAGREDCSFLSSRKKRWVRGYSTEATAIDLPVALRVGVSPK